MYTAFEIIEIFDHCNKEADADKCRDLLEEVLPKYPELHLKLMARCYTNCITKLIEK